jgi:hypothetical protein
MGRGGSPRSEPRLVQPIFSQPPAAATDRTAREKRARAKKELLIRRARRSAAAFIEYALRQEADDTVLKNAPFHEEWHEHLEENRLAVLICSVEHGKTQQVAVGKALHMIGTNPESRGAIISSTALQAEKVLRQIRAEIERNPRVREVFPHLKPSERDEDPWHSSQITVQRKTRSKDPTLQVMGLYGPLVGSRLDWVILDDVLDFENTRTEEQRKKTIEWVDTTVITRLWDHARFIAIGTPWHPDDLLHVLEKRPGFVTRRYSAVENPDDPPKRWRPLWPQQWPLPRLLERKAITPDGVFTRKYLCRVRIDATSRFRQAWLDRMCLLGKGRTFLAQAPRAHVRGQRLPCFTGVDLGVGGGPENARTVLFTIALMPDSRRLIVEIESGQWQAPEIIDRLVGVYRRFDSDILVENNGAQQFLIDMCRGLVPVRGQTTDAGKKFSETFGVETLAVEMRNGLWLMPSGSTGENVHEEGKAFMNECLYYDPELHTGDRLMAAWLARECLRKYAQPMNSHQNVQAR